MVIATSLKQKEWEYTLLKALVTQNSWVRLWLTASVKQMLWVYVVLTTSFKQVVCVSCDHSEIHPECVGVHCIPGASCAESVRAPGAHDELQAGVVPHPTGWGC